MLMNWFQVRDQNCRSLTVDDSSSDYHPGLCRVIPEVDVRIFTCRSDGDLPDTFAATLDARERNRAALFRFDLHRRRFILAHGALRKVLGEFLNRSAADVAIEQADFGKPFLPDSDIFFNMSHSEECIVIAVRRGKPVGVDVEFIRPVTDMLAIVEENFYPHERSLLNSQEMFFKYWTRKEALIKAVGRGISIPLTSFDNVVPSVGDWQILDLQGLPPGYAGAIAL
jgi:4'-phosphopantetheinyl transferase